jgi:purine-nucleoside phosphorylase
MHISPAFATLARRASEAQLRGLYEKIEEATRFVEERVSIRPRFAIVLGTGLGAAADAIETDAAIPYEEIPHFVKATGLGHAGELIVGRLGGKDVVAMHGRLHYGADELVMSGAVGGMDPHLDRGDIVALTDHINLIGDNPLIGWNDDRLGQRFPDMAEPYCNGRRALVELIALEKGITVRRAVLAAVAGPNLETAAEYRMLRRMGADVVGMSTVPEVIVAAHSGMKVMALSIVTDLCMPDHLEPANIKEIIATAETTAPKLVELVTEYLERM